MEAEPEGYERVYAVILKVVAFKPLGVALIARYRAAHDCTEAHFPARFNIIIKLKIHIKACRHTACKVFKVCKLCKPVDVLPRQLCFKGENLVKQPLLQRQVIGVGTQKCHCRMCMRILERRHHKVFHNAYLTLKACFFKLFLCGHANKGYFITVCPYLALGYLKGVITRKGHYTCIFKAYHSFFLSSEHKRRHRYPRFVINRHICIVKIIIPCVLRL